MDVCNFIFLTTHSLKILIPLFFYFSAYFPREPSLQCILVESKCVEKMFTVLVEPLSKLQLNEIEISLFYIIVIISSSLFVF